MELIVSCPACGTHSAFNQPYPYHAGFSEAAFVYNEAGNCTLIWATYDPEYVRRLADASPWAPPVDVRTALEAALPTSPHGDRWRFEAPARCCACAHPLHPPMSERDLHYLEYPGSIVLGRAGISSGLADYLRAP